MLEPTESKFAKPRRGKNLKPVPLVKDTSHVHMQKKWFEIINQIAYTRYNIILRCKFFISYLNEFPSNKLGIQLLVEILYPKENWFYVPTLKISRD